jgi:hypothetical protein
MNDRIRQLLLDSGGQYSSGNQNDWPSWVLGDAVVTKFAELIVRECIAMCDVKSEDPLLYKQGVIFAVNRCQQNIKQHFGVEE